nr:hypothetical protein [uncultured archaeon]
MEKRGKSVTFDLDIFEAVENICSEGYTSKFSNVVNKCLRDHPDIKKRLKKK